MARLSRATPTVELSVVATSEELEILALAAQHRQMTLKDFLRLQLVAVAKAALKAERAPKPDVLPKPVQSLALPPPYGPLKPAFLP